MSFKKTLAGVILGIVASTAIAKAKISFPSSGVWAQPRIYDKLTGKEVSDYNNIFLGEYQFKTKLIEVDGEDSTTTLFGEVIGPNNFYISHEWEEINIAAGKSSIRYWTGTLSEVGQHQLIYKNGKGEIITRNFNVVPEPTSLLLLVPGYFALIRKK